MLMALSENRGDDAEADEDGGGGREEFFLAAKPLSTRKLE